MSFFRVDCAHWERARLALAGRFRWSLELALVDLRHFQNGSLAFGKPFPTRRKLGADWGWSASSVSRLLVQVDRWSDPSKLEAWNDWWLEFGRGSSVEQNRFKPGSNVVQNRTKTTTAKPDNGGKPDQARFKPGSSVEQNRTKHEHARGNKQEQEQEQQQERKTESVLRIWLHYREAWKRVHGTGLNHKPPKRAGLKTLVAEHGEQAVLDLVDWWEASPDERATFLRNRRIGHSTLFRASKAEEYLDQWVAPWLARKSSTPSTEAARPVDAPNFLRRLRGEVSVEPGTIIDAREL